MPGVYPADQLVAGAVATEYFLQRVADLPQGGAGAGGFHGGGQEVIVPPGGGGEFFEGGGVGFRVALRFGPLDLVDLLLPDALVVYFQQVKVRSLTGAEDVDADDLLPPAVDSGLLTGTGLLDAQFGQPAFDGPYHAAGLVDLLHQLAGFADQSLGLLLDGVATAPGIDGGGDAKLPLQIELGVTGDLGAVVCG